MKFIKFTEENEWEGETWYFYLPYDGNEVGLIRFATMIRHQAAETPSGIPYSFAIVPENTPEHIFEFVFFDEQTVDALVAYGNDDRGMYHPAHTKVEGVFVFPEDFKPKSEEDFDSILYKGGIEDFFSSDKSEKDNSSE